METTTIGRSNKVPTSEQQSSKSLFRIRSMPDIDLLPPKAWDTQPHYTEDPGLLHAKDLLCRADIHHSLRRLPDKIDHLPCHLQEYVKWMISVRSEHADLLPESVEELCQQLGNSDPEGRMLVHIARSLDSVLRVETDALALLLENGILTRIYTRYFNIHQYLPCVLKQLDLFAHKYPSMRVLEIGASTGMTTASAMDALKNRFVEYVYTDTTPTFLAIAEKVLKSPKVTIQGLRSLKRFSWAGYRARVPRSRHRYGCKVKFVSDNASLIDFRDSKYPWESEICSFTTASYFDHRVVLSSRRLTAVL